MLQKVKITAVYRGKQLVKKGTPDEKEIDKIAIKIEPVVVGGISFGGDDKTAWLSTFKVNGTEKFVEGMEVELSLEKKGDYYNFSLPSDLEKRVMALEVVVFPASGGTAGIAGTEGPAIITATPSDDINPEDIPF